MKYFSFKQRLITHVPFFTSRKKAPNHLYSENEHLLLLNCLYISWKRNRAGICDMHHVNFNQNQNIQICIRLDSAITMTIFSVILMTLNNWWSSKSAIQWTLLVQEQPHSFFFFYVIFFILVAHIFLILVLAC
jgi:hypothetical protein